MAYTWLSDEFVPDEFSTPIAIHAHNADPDDIVVELGGTWDGVCLSLNQMPRFIAWLTEYTERAQRHFTEPSK